MSENAKTELFTKSELVAMAEAIGHRLAGEIEDYNNMTGDERAKVLESAQRKLWQRIDRIKEKS